MFQFIIKNLATGNERTLERPLFPCALKARFIAFTEAARALNETSFVKGWSEIKISIHVAPDGQISDAGNLPSDDAIAAFLHRLRPFYLVKEDLHFNSVCKALGKHLDDHDVALCLRHWRRHYDGRASKELFEIGAGGKLLNSEEYLDHYLNALEYHRDKDRLKVINDVSQFFPLGAQKSVIVYLLSMRVNAINMVASLLCMCFDREDGRPITLQI